MTWNESVWRRASQSSLFLSGAAFQFLFWWMFLNQILECVFFHLIRRPFHKFISVIFKVDFIDFLSFNILSPLTGNRTVSAFWFRLNDSPSFLWWFSINVFHVIIYIDIIDLRLFISRSLLITFGHLNIFIFFQDRQDHRWF